ncbi:receptor-interacting serine/threonine-protein kinase 1 [Leucoraja erinacea]|uniref:receptor-interacting serine/threonine-protein kinase 1 n=1 Tax=Leucoraja erinaceus TaxID=7782 RepID=UPI002456A600|nr:receptor-interacting serine/threonine-protein kinase 1 [Leucoraja erinacea]
MSGTAMSFDEIYIDSKELIEKRLLGGGGYGMVSLCHRKDHGLVVLKTVYTGPQRMEFSGSLLDEGKMMHKLNHERVIKLIGIILEDGNYSLVMEFMVNGNLLQLLKSVTIPLSVKGRIILEIIEGMTYLHNMRIVHKDLKPENILVDANFHIKIADLGVSIFKTWSQLTTEELKRRRQMSSKLQNNAGTLAYLAPEHLESLKTKATEKSDVYSFSIVVWVILSNTEPYENAVSNIQVMHLVQNGDRPDLELIPNEVPELLVSLMQQCWEKQPVDRPTFTECNLQFQPFYEQNFQRFIDKDVERLRELTQETPTASRQLVKRMTSLQVDCVGLMPDTPTRDDPFSLHSSQVASANGHLLEGSFNASGLSQPVENQQDSSCESREDEQVRRKLGEELRYHKTGSRLDASLAAGSRPGVSLAAANRLEGIRDELMKERSKRVSNEPAFGSSYPAVATGLPRAEPNEDLYTSHHPSADLSRLIKEETNFQHPSKHSYPGYLVDYRSPALQTPALVPTPETNASSKAQLGTWNQYPWGGTQSVSDIYVGNYIRSPVSQTEPSNLKNFGQESQHSICLSHTRSVQIGDNNTMYVEKKVTNKKKHKGVKPPRQTANAHLQQNLVSDGRPVTESHLDLLRGELGKDWKQCARKLGFREPEIDEIDHDYERDGLKEKVYKMLHKWQMKEGFKGATLGKVVQALLSCERSDLVLHLQKCS